MSIQQAPKSRIPLSAKVLAVLVVIIVIIYILLISLPHVGPTPTSRECIFPAGLQCLNWQVLANGTLTINIVQTFNAPINITGISCTNNQTNGIPSLPSPIQMPNDSNYTFTVSCTKAGTAYTGTAGSPFTGVVGINYTDTVNGTDHIAFGQIVSKYT